MRLVWIIALRLTPWIAAVTLIWAVAFNRYIQRAINDEVDDALEDYSQMLMVRYLAGEDMPSTSDGTNNYYAIREVTPLYRETHEMISYIDSTYFLDYKNETEPARVYKTIFTDAEGRDIEMVVATPTFERDDIIHTVLIWSVALFLSLFAVVVILCTLTVGRSMKPLYRIIGWLDSFTFGKDSKPVPTGGGVKEFEGLSDHIRESSLKAHALYEQQKEFIGNASHELQTPLAVMGGKLEMLLNDPALTEQNGEAIYSILETQRDMVRLVKTLLLLSRIDSDMYYEAEEFDLGDVVSKQAGIFEEIFTGRGITLDLSLRAPCPVNMDRSLATVLVSNLIKNAYVHSDEGGTISLVVDGGGLRVANSGTRPLDKEKIFSRFATGGGASKGSFGIGLSMAGAISRKYGFVLDYSFVDGEHVFTLDVKGRKKQAR